MSYKNICCHHFIHICSMVYIWHTFFTLLLAIIAYVLVARLNKLLDLFCLLQAPFLSTTPNLGSEIFIVISCNIKMVESNYYLPLVYYSSYHSQFTSLLPFNSSKLISSATSWPSVTHLFLLITFCIGPACSISCTYPGDRDDRWIQVNKIGLLLLKKLS